MLKHVLLVADVFVNWSNGGFVSGKNHPRESQTSIDSFQIKENLAGPGLFINGKVETDF